MRTYDGGKTLSPQFLTHPIQSQRGQLRKARVRPSSQTSRGVAGIAGQPQPHSGQASTPFSGTAAFPWSHHSARQKSKAKWRSAMWPMGGSDGTPPKKGPLLGPRRPRPPYVRVEDGESLAAMKPPDRRRVWLSARLLRDIFFHKETGKPANQTSGTPLLQTV